MSDLCVFLCCLTGFALLLMAMGRHQPDWFGAKLARPVTLGLRTGGFGLLSVAWLTAVLTQGFAYGTVIWFGWLTVTALIVIAININRDVLLKWPRR